MSLRTDLGKLRRLSLGQVVMLFEAMALLGVMRAAILAAPFRWLASLLGLELGSGTTRTDFHQAQEVSLVAWAIRSAAARTPWNSTCLAQAMAAALMLKRRRISSSLYLGVAKEEGGSGALSAHAWLCCGDMVATGGFELDRFSPISCFLCRGFGSGKGADQ